VHSQGFGGEEAPREKGTHGFKNDLVFRLKKDMVVKSMHEFGALLAGATPVAQRVEDFEFGRQYRRTIHGYFLLQGNFSSVRTWFLKSKLAGSAHAFYSIYGFALEHSSAWKGLRRRRRVAAQADGSRFSPGAVEEAIAVTSRRNKKVSRLWS
jgi:hypothetical protein